MKNKVCFVSGHLDLTADEFNSFYKDKLDRALSDGCSFIIGDARGADTLSQEYLSDKTTNVTIYHMFEKPRNNVGKFRTIGGFKSDMERDRQMTQDSDIDIAFVREGREKSGTAKNIARRKLEG